MAENMSREDNIYFARLSEQGERYEDMINYMKKVAMVSHSSLSYSIRTTRSCRTTRGTY